MVSRVYIIHGSAIVQNGLADILRKNFKCAIKLFSNIESLKSEDENFSSKSLFFTEDEIANTEEYLDFINSFEGIKSFSIGYKNELTNNQYSISIYDSPDKIYEHVKQYFKQYELVPEETEGISNREIDVLKLVALGYSNKEIADKLFISTHTVMSHRKNMTEKLGIKSISGLTVYAIINNYIDTTNLDINDLI